MSALVFLALALMPAVQAQDTFFHERHERLFPVCTGCHAGIESGEAAAIYPQPARCAVCHNGRLARQVKWAGPAPRPSNLRFSHSAHAEKIAAAGESATCQTCHRLPGQSARMAVGAPARQNCETCHTHADPPHLAREAACTTCHRTLAEANALPPERIARFPKPGYHGPTGFLLDHAVSPGQAQASCAVCHARQSCERCHANAPAVAAIQALAPDPRVASLVRGRAASYPTPPDHLSRGWGGVKHAVSARKSVAECANCHTQPSCGACHGTVPSGSPIARLPVPVRDGPQGVKLAALRVHADVPGFATNHGAAAGAKQPNCSSCHTEASCAACHDRAASPRFHLPNFMARHGADAFARMSDCSSCHSTEAFCRACHVGSGIRSDGRLDAPFHDRQPMWLLSHGQAARQDLESCVACHQQRDCLQCHSVTVGWGVSPHGPGFDPSRIADRNKLLCRRCHVGDPLRKP